MITVAFSVSEILYEVTQEYSDLEEYEIRQIDSWLNESCLESCHTTKVNFI